MNWFQSGQACVPCEAGQYTESEGSVECSPATTNTTQTDCPAGSIPYYYYYADRECIPCQAGWFQEEQKDSCTPCPMGQYAEEAGSTSCRACDKGTYSILQQGASQCTVCSPGHYTNMTGQTTCSACDGQGFWSNPPVGGTECRLFECDAHSYFSARIIHSADPGQSDEYEGCIQCTECEPQFFTLQMCGDDHDTVCAPCTEICPHRSTLTKYCTLYSDSECTAICMPGEIKANASVCIPCPRGTMLDMASEGCIPCPNGMYNGEEGSTACHTCAPTNPSVFPNGNKTGCVQACELGSVMNIVDTQENTNTFYCEECLPGTYHDLATGICAPCPANSFAEARGQVSCDSCPSNEGAVSLPGSAACSLQTCKLLIIGE